MRNWKGILLAFAAVLSLSVACARAETVCEVQAYNPADGLSPLNGKTVTVTGIVTVPSGIFQPTQTSVYIRGIGDDNCGVDVFSRTQVSNIALGDTLTVRGPVQEYISTGGNGAITEVTFTAAGDLTLKKGTGAVEPEVMSTGQAGREASEGKLVRVTGKLVTALLGRSFSMDDGTGLIEIYDFGQNFASDPIWRSLEYGGEVTVTGVVSQSDPDLPYLSGYSINPRHPQFGDVGTPQCIPGGTPKASLKLSSNIFSPEYGEKITVVYDCPNRARLRLRVFDSCGRCVANLDDRTSLCGESQILWDGRNEIKELLPAGLYHVVVTATDDVTGAESQEIVPVVIGRRLK